MESNSFNVNSTEWKLKLNPICPVQSTLLPAPGCLADWLASWFSYSVQLCECLYLL